MILYDGKKTQRNESKEITSGAGGWERYSIDRHTQVFEPCVSREILWKNYRELILSDVDGEKQEPSAGLYSPFSYITQRMVFVQGGKGGGHNSFTTTKLELVSIEINSTEMAH